MVERVPKNPMKKAVRRSEPPNLTRLTQNDYYTHAHTHAAFQPSSTSKEDKTVE
jgi:hypothetical protein